MNIAIVGSKNVNKLADVLYQSFDGLNVVGYDDVRQFRQAMVTRPLDFHRMLLLEAAVSGEDISTDDIYDFQDMVLANYPAMKIATISTDVEYTKFLASLFNGQNYGHFCFSSLKGKILVDLVSKDMPELYRKYAANAYKEKVESKEEILDGDKIITTVQEENKADISGYIAPNQGAKRSFIDKVLGRGPKNTGNLIKDGGLAHIGQGTGMTEFTEDVQGVDFYGESTEKVEEEDSVIDVDSYDYSNPVEETEMEDFSGFIQDEETEKFEIFGSMYSPVDIGIGHIEESEEVERPIVYLEKETPRPVVELRKPIEEEPIPFDINRLEKEEYVPLLDVEEIEAPPIIEDETEDINIPTVDLNSFRKTVEETDFNLSSDNFMQPNFIEHIDVEDADVGAFDGDMGALMSEYDKANQPQVVVKEIEKVVERVIQVGGATAFRNKNGIKILIVTGDRRVGSTKLALNLANKFSSREKVLYVDFDRHRHGSLGYIDLEGLLEEPEHVQNGINHLKNPNIFKNVCHYYKKGRFFTLTSMYGSYVSDEQMKVVQNILASQRDYTTVIIDCPIEDLDMLKTIIPFSKVLLCAEDDKVGIINLMNMLNSNFEDEGILYTFFERTYFVIGRKCNVEKFKAELFNVVNLFDIEETKCNWANVEIVGVTRDINSLVERLGD